MVKKVSCRVIKSNPLGKNSDTSLIRFSFKDARLNNPSSRDLKAKAKLYFDNGAIWQDFNCRA